jgi:hypothetical protein
LRAWPDRGIVYSIVHKEEFSVTWYMCDTTLDERASIFIRDKPILKSERMLCKEYGRKDSVAKRNNLWSWVSRGLAARRAV